MQDDIADGTNWMIKQGYTDPQRVCIVGSSYGGYAALMGSVKTPDLYKCAVSFAGVSDILLLVKSHRAYQSYEIVKKQFGTNFSEQRSRSPAYNANAINIPILLIHGDKDRVVDSDHSKKMVKALREANKDVTYVELENGTHYLNNGDNRVSAFTSMDAFLSQHLSK